MKNLEWLIGILATASTIHAGIVGVQSVQALSQTADAIVVGSATGTLVWGSGADFSLSVVRVVNGPSAIAGTPIAVHWDMGGPNGLLVRPGATVPVAGNGIWFLRNNGGSWSLLPVEQGSIGFEQTYYSAPLSPLPAAYAYASTAPLADKVASEVGAAVEALNGNFNHPLYGLLRGGLDQLNSPVTSVLYQRLANSASVPQQILGLAGLIRSGTLSGLAPAVSFSASSFSSHPLEYGILLSAVRDEFRPSDSASIALLGQAATDQNNPNTAFREAAAHALASVHSAATLPYLAALLQDPSTALQVEGIRGLAAFANGLPVQTSAQVASLAYLQLPATAPYRTADTMAHFAMGSTAIKQNEPSYLSFWKEWWTANQASLGF